MIAYAIHVAMVSGLFEHVVVTTDDEQIAKVANEHGAETPFMRPPGLADDHSPIVPVVAHAIDICEALGWQITRACCIFPCVPFIQIEDIKAALRLLDKSGADFSFPVAEFPSAIQRALKRDGDGLLSPFFPEYELTRTQDLEPAYFDAGQFYWGAKEAWITNARIHSSGVGLVVPSWRVIDIDTPDDWQRAEKLHQAIAR